MKGVKGFVELLFGGDDFGDAGNGWKHLITLSVALYVLIITVMIMSSILLIVGVTGLLIEMLLILMISGRRLTLWQGVVILIMSFSMLSVFIKG